MYTSFMGTASPLNLNPKTTALEMRAADNLQFIRETMERASAFTAVPGEGGIIIGLTALAAGWLARSYPVHIQFWIWLWEGLLAAALGFASLYRKSKQTGFPLTSKSARRALLSFLTPITAGAILTAALYRSDALHLFAGAWLLLYGIAVVNAGAFSVRIVPVMGLCFLVLGTVALFTPPAFNDGWMMAGFGALHILFGWVIARKYGG